jgi:hypothetical protein
MDGIVRRLKINELKSRIFLCELERKSLQREIPSQEQHRNVAPGSFADWNARILNTGKP